MHCIRGMKVLLLIFPTPFSILYSQVLQHRVHRFTNEERRIFMNNIYHDLALLYLKQKDISSFIPAELYNEYHKVYKEISHEAQKQTPKAVIR